MLTTITLVLVLGVVAIWVAWRMRLPSILVLLAVGLLAGPVARWVSLILFWPVIFAHIRHKARRMGLVQRRLTSTSGLYLVGVSG